MARKLSGAKALEGIAELLEKGSGEIILVRDATFAGAEQYRATWVSHDKRSDTSQGVGTSAAEAIQQMLEEA